MYVEIVDCERPAFSWIYPTHTPSRSACSGNGGGKFERSLSQAKMLRRTGLLSADMALSMSIYRDIPIYSNMSSILCGLPNHWTSRSLKVQHRSNWALRGHRIQRSIRVAVRLRHLRGRPLAAVQRNIRMLRCGPPNLPFAARAKSTLNEFAGRGQREPSARSDEWRPS